jgi:hypothetical protein
VRDEEGQPKWLQYLFNAIFYFLHKRNYDVDELPIKIITFNYDSLLEQHFYEWVTTNSLLVPEQKKKVIQLFCQSIRHIYGQIGYLAEDNNLIDGPQDCTSDEFIPIQHDMQTETKRRMIRNMALYSTKRIGLINYGKGEDETTNRANKDHIKDAQEWLTKTNTLLISGYSFDDENNQQLNLSELSKSIPHIHCTVREVGFSLIDTVKQTFHAYKNNNHPSLHARDIWMNGEYIGGIRMPDNFLKIYNSTTLEMLSKEINLVKLSSNLK